VDAASRSASATAPSRARRVPPAAPQAEAAAAASCVAVSGGGGIRARTAGSVAGDSPPQPETLISSGTRAAGQRSSGEGPPQRSGGERSGRPGFGRDPVPVHGLAGRGPEWWQPAAQAIAQLVGSASHQLAARGGYAQGKISQANDRGRPVSAECACRRALQGRGGLGAPQRGLVKQRYRGRLRQCGDSLQLGAGHRRSGRLRAGPAACHPSASSSPGWRRDRKALGFAGWDQLGPRRCSQASPASSASPAGDRSRPAGCSIARRDWCC